jgi:hypothetical protein
MSEYPHENDQLPDQTEASAADLESRIYQAGEASAVDVGPVVEGIDGTKTATLGHIPFDKDYATQAAYVHDASNAAAAQGANRLEYFLGEGFATANNIQDADLLRLGFHKSETNAAGSTWHKPVLR